jgi:hypothetical protein
MLAHEEIQLFQQNYNTVKTSEQIKEYWFNYYTTIKIGSSSYRTTL